MSEPTSTYSKGIFSSDHKEARERIVALLAKAYWMEIETVMTIAGDYSLFAHLETV